MQIPRAHFAYRNIRECVTEHKQDVHNMLFVHKEEVHSVVYNYRKNVVYFWQIVVIRVAIYVAIQLSGKKFYKLSIS